LQFFGKLFFAKPLYQYRSWSDVEPGALQMRPSQHHIICQLERQRLGSPAGKIATVVILLLWAFQIFAFHKPNLQLQFELEDLV
jgi:hypothetical protein